jgi:TRAP-type C4-dicarboxylate transport system substrate-binding protein
MIRLSERISKMRKMNKLTVLLVATFLVTGGVMAQSIRLATLAPTGTSMHKSLLKMGNTWKKAGVRLTIYPDGKMGGEADMVKRMRVGQIQAALLTVQGLSVIDESARAVQLVPMMFKDLKEFDAAFSKVGSLLEKRFEAKGYKVLFWSDIGYLRFFSTKPGRRIDDYRKMKMFVYAGDTQTQKLMEELKLRGVPLDQSDMLTGLQTGLVDMLTTAPVFGLSGQIYRSANNMLNLNWNPLVGGLVVNLKDWNRLSPAKQKAMTAAATLSGREIRAYGRRESELAVQAMQKRGLNVIEPTPEDVADWEKFAEQLYPKLRGKVVDEELFDLIKNSVADYRKRAAK